MSLDDDLWAALHDATIRAVVATPSGLALACEVPHLRDEAEEAAGLTFDLHFADPSEARAWVTPAPADPFPEVAGESRDDRGRRIVAWQATWREEPLAFGTFAATIAENPLTVSTAVSVGEGGVEIVGHLDGRATDDLYTRVRVVAGRISATRSDGRPFGLPAWLDLGRRYWDAFASARPRPRPDE